MLATRYSNGSTTSTAHDSRRPTSAQRRDSLASVCTVGVWEQICAICLSPPDQDSVTTSCGHTFCRECLAQVRQPRCPECRSELDRSGSPTASSPTTSPATSPAVVIRSRARPLAAQPRGLSDLPSDVSERLVGLLFTPRVITSSEGRGSSTDDHRPPTDRDDRLHAAELGATTHRNVHRGLHTPTTEQLHQPESPRSLRSHSIPSQVSPAQRLPPLSGSAWESTSRHTARAPHPQPNNKHLHASRPRRVFCGTRPTSGWLVRYQAIDVARHSFH